MLRWTNGLCLSVRGVGFQWPKRDTMVPGSLKRVSSTDRDISPPSSKRKITGTTTKSVVSNFFKPVSQKEPPKLTFSILHDTLLVARYQDAHLVSRPRPLKVAAFDFDDSLITTKSGNKFARGPDDWKWWDAVVPAQLKSLDAQGYAVVVMSNQAAISLRSDPKSPKDGMKSFNNFKAKITAVLGALDFPITVYAATGPDLYRKPRSGMWEQLLNDYKLMDHGDIDHEQCIFVGDAAGREADKSTGSKKDHSCSDRNFAANVSIPFHTPEEYFLGEAPKPYVQSFDPGQHVQSIPETDVGPVRFTRKHDLDLVLFCGSPGAGKSTFYWNHLQPLGYARVNQDLLKSREKCLKVAAQTVEGGVSVVVDNTNADIETRAAWIALARRLKVPIRLVHFTSPAKLCEHNDTVRALAGEMFNPEERIQLPRMAFSGFAARYYEPDLEEGFEDITKIDFTFHGTETQKTVWTRHWIS